MSVSTRANSLLVASLFAPLFAAACSQGDEPNVPSSSEQRLTELESNTAALEAEVGDCIENGQACMLAAETAEEFGACTDELAECLGTADPPDFPPVDSCLQQAAECLENASTLEEADACAEDAATCVGFDPGETLEGLDTCFDDAMACAGAAKTVAEHRACAEEFAACLANDLPDLPDLPDVPLPDVPDVGSCHEDLQACLDAGTDPMVCVDQLPECVGDAVDDHVSEVCEQVIQDCLDSGTLPELCEGLDDFGPCAGT
jgi:hypothetical protein